jgi:Flp pilus assembly protein TadD
MAPHSLERHGDATNALSVLARARTTKPRDARARNSLIAICAAGMMDAVVATD